MGVCKFSSPYLSFSYLEKKSLDLSTLWNRGSTLNRLQLHTFFAYFFRIWYLLVLIGMGTINHDKIRNIGVKVRFGQI